MLVIGPADGVTTCETASHHAERSRPGRGRGPRRESPRAGGEHLGGRPGETQAHAEVRDPAELPAQAAATGDLPDCHAQAARLVGRLGGGAVRRGDNESGETGGDVRQVDEVQGAVAARAAAKDGEVLSADDGAEDSEGATDRRKGGRRRSWALPFVRGWRDCRTLLKRGAYSITRPGCSGAGPAGPIRNRTGRIGPVDPVRGESVRLGADRSGSVSWEPGGWCPAAARSIGEVVRGSCDWRRGR